MNQSIKKIFLIFLFSTFAFLLLLLVITCSKEYSYEGGPPAVYTLEGSPDACTNTNISGAYYAGIPVDSADNVQVTAQVTTPGSYNITTNTINGISFSASGNFPDTGFYNVVLKANGTPDSAGIYKLQIPGNNGCFFSIEVKGKPPADYLLSGTLSDCENPEINGNYMENMILGSLNNIVVNVEVFTTGDYTITTDTVNGIFFSASGYFNTTGKQQVTLNGSGTPAFPGLFYFKVYAGTSECGFKIPIQTAEPVATYVLESGFGSPNPCTPQSVKGNYTTAVPLSSVNKVDITVFVTVLGNFSISTDSTNGMIFKYSGKFTVPGEQTVTLSGSGTPNTSGIFTFAPLIIGPAPLGGQTCGFDITVQ